MADRIGVQRKWIQQAGTPDEHFDIAKSKRALAVKAGAVEVSSYDLVVIIDRRRPVPRWPDKMLESERVTVPTDTENEDV